MQLDSNGNLFATLNEKDVTKVDLKNTGVFNSPNFSEVGITDGLVAYYPLNGNAKDYTMNRNDGVVYGATVAPGIDGKLCYEFDGSSDNVATPFIPNATTLGQSFTWSFWNNFKSFANEKGSHGVNSTSPRFYVQLTSTSGVFRTAIGDFYTNTLPAGALKLNTWHNISITFDAGTVLTYLDGELKHTQVGVIFTGTGAIYRIGAGYSNARNLDGYSFGHRIYNRALSADEIALLYDLEKPNATQMKISNDAVYISGEFDEVTN